MTYAETLATEQVEIVCRLLVVIDEQLAPLVAELVQVDKRRAAARAASGEPYAIHPPAAALATEVILAALEPLRPHVQFVCRESGEQARRRLLAIATAGGRS